jgi:hypothetical protein
MSVPDRYIRLFDLAKYREIQPITDGTKQRNADSTGVINLIQRAMNVVQSSEFEKYNGRDHIFMIELEDALEIMQEKSLSDWPLLYQLR